MRVPLPPRSARPGPGARRRGAPPAPAGPALAGPALAAALLCLALPAGAEIAVDRGDVLAVTVAQEPALDREARVDANGDIMLPQLGRMAVAGLDTDTIRQRIEAALKEKRILLAPSVVVEVATYRPFYVGGAVARPGAVDFAPGLTVRHALILAGGGALGAGERAVSPAAVLELRAQLKAASFRLQQMRTRIARLRAEIAEADAPAGPEAPRPAALAPGDAAKIAELDSALLADRRSQSAEDAQHTEKLLDLLDLELSVLGEQSTLQEADRDGQAAEVANARSLVERGLMPRPRLQELEREARGISRDLLENRAFTARARQAKETTAHELEAAQTARRIEARSALSEAMAEEAGLAAQVDSLTAQLAAAGVAPGSNGQPELQATIHRIVDGEDQAIPAGMTTELAPGDIVEFLLPGEPRG